MTLPASQPRDATWNGVSHPYTLGSTIQKSICGTDIFKSREVEPKFSKVELSDRPTIRLSAMSIQRLRDNNNYGNDYSYVSFDRHNNIPSQQNNSMKQGVPKTSIFDVTPGVGR
jgi:hypothetical protein